MVQAHIEAALADTPLAGDFAQPVWGDGNAKAPDANAADARIADRLVLARVDALHEAERSQVHTASGPTTDLAELLAMRWNAPSLPTWDIEAVLDPNATVPVDAASLVIHNPDAIVRFVGNRRGLYMRCGSTRPTRPAT